MKTLNDSKRVGTGWFTLHFKGDGSLFPKIIIRDNHGNEAHGFTDSDEIRRMAKTLKRWAKFLEEQQSEQANT